MTTVEGDSSSSPERETTRAGRPGAAGARPKVLVAGGGVAGLEFALALAELAPGHADVKILSPTNVFTYRPFAIAETFGAERSFQLKVSRVAADAGATWHEGELASIDRQLRLAYCSSGEVLPYELLVIAAGARAETAVPGALTFAGPDDEPAFRVLLADLASGRVASVAFVVPPGPSWPLPLYELALMTAAELGPPAVRRAKLLLVTPESAPLERFDGAASAAVAELLDAAGIEVRCGQDAAELGDGRLRLAPGGWVDAERVVALPRLRGPLFSGFARDRDGFLRTDRFGLVLGTDDAYAVGDVTSFPIKNGGIAIQQAGAAAEAVAARIGVSLRPQPFRPVLRGLLLTGHAPLFLHADPAAAAGETSAVAYQPLWWPPAKIAGGRLARYLHAAGLPVPEPPAGPARIPVQLELALDEAEAEPVSAQ